MANKQSILVIEDEKNIGNYIETILASNGYKVLRAMNGMTGLSLCTSHFPEVYICRGYFFLFSNVCIPSEVRLKFISE